MFKPVPRLPTKLLPKIFVMARDTLTVQADTFALAFVHDSLPERSFNTASWNISQVCRRCRAVSVGYSHLWSYFSMDLQRRRKGPSNNALCLAAIQIARATRRGLYFSLQFKMLPPPICSLPSYHCVSVRQAAGNTSSSLWKTPLCWMSSSLSMLDCLESLHIRIHDGRLPSPGAHISSIFQDACHLTEVVESSYDVTRIILPWTNIERSS